MPADQRCELFIQSGLRRANKEDGWAFYPAVLIRWLNHNNFLSIHSAIKTAVFTTSGLWLNIQICIPSQLLISFVIVLIEKAMAPHSSTLAWKIPWMEEPGRLQSIGSLRVGHDWATSLSLFTFMHWRRKWQPTPVFLPGESQGQGSLVGCCLWGRTELDMTEVT